MNTIIKKIVTICVSLVLIINILAISRIGSFTISVQAEEVTLDRSWYDNDPTLDVYHIYNAQQLLGLANIVNTATGMSKDTFKDKTVILENDIDLLGIEWTPIGTVVGTLTKQRKFQGTFDGNGKKIKNMLIKDSAEYSDTKNNYGLFSYVTLGTIKDLTVEGSIIVDNPTSVENQARGFAGGIVGQATGTTIENCTFIGTIDAGERVGGIVGYIQSSNTIKNCKIISESGIKGVYDVGGIVGQSVGTDAYPNMIIDCSFKGKVTSSKCNVGGIIGNNYNAGNTNIGTIDNCIVEENSTVSGSGTVGGIVGKANCEILECKNNAKVNGSSYPQVEEKYVGGIVGYGNGATLSSSVNYGEVTASGDECLAGGIVGLQIGSVSNVGNAGSVSSDSTGSAAGIFNSKQTIKLVNAYNAGSLSADKSYAIATDAEATNTYYDSKLGSSDIGEGKTTEEFKDRTVVDLLNGESDSPVWFQNTEYPDFASNMTLITDITVPATFIVEEGKTAKLLATVAPENATNPTLTYASKEESVATIAADGTVTGVKAGEAELEVKALDSGMTKTVKVTVKAEEKKTEEDNKKEDTTETKPAVQNGSKKTVGKSTYTVTDAQAKTVTYTAPTNKKLTSVSVPETIKIDNVSYKVTAIANNAFLKNKKLKSVVIGKNIKTIGKNAFSGCSSLKKITVKTTVLSKVGSKAFKGIHKKAVIKVPSKKLKAYKKLLKGKGQSKTVKIKK